MSKPTKLRNLYARYGANAATNSSTIPAMGSDRDFRSRLMGAATWVVAMRKITTITSFDAISATTNVAHFPNQPRDASQVRPASATGPNTIATSSKAFRMRRLNQRMKIAAIMRPARKIVSSAPAPPATEVMVTAVMRSASRSSMLSIVCPVAWMMPTQS